MIYTHCSGVLLRAPESRTSSKGTGYTTGMLKSTTKDGDAVVSFICFAEDAQQELQALVAGDPVTVAGPGKLSQWTGKDGVEKHGLSVVADKVLSSQPPDRKAFQGKRDTAPTGRWQAPPRAHAGGFDDSLPF